MKKHFNTSPLKFLFISLLALTFSFSPASAIAATISASITSISVLPNADAPAYIYIPSINLLTNVQGVGINKVGNMDVPSGKTNNVGWYEYGVVPGNTGTAVLDAHNTAAFKNLKNVPLGADVYIVTQRGKWLHFAVRQANTYSMQTLKPSTLFANTSHPQLNLITCAGQLLGNGNATHRLIVSAQLV